MTAEQNKATASLYMEETVTQTIFYQDALITDGKHIVNVNIPLLNIKSLARIFNHHSPWYDRGEGVKLLVHNVILRYLLDAVNNFLWQSEDNCINRCVLARAIIYYVSKWVNVTQPSYRELKSIYNEVNYIDGNFLSNACLEIAVYLVNATSGEVLCASEFNIGTNGGITATIAIQNEVEDEISNQ
jgi:hypothetical protein